MHYKKIFISVIALSVLLSSSFSTLTTAAGWPTNWYGYFSNDTGWACTLSSDVIRCPVLPAKLNSSGYNGNALESINYATSSLSSAQKAQILYDEIKSYYDGTHPNIAATANASYYYKRSAWSSNLNVRKYQARIGAAFIARTMLGKSGGINVTWSGGGATKNLVSSSDWQTLHDRLQDRAAQGRINWNVNKSRANQKNTALFRTYSGSTTTGFDVRSYTETSSNSRRGLTIYNDNGTIAYEMLYQCANPIGPGVGGSLPPATNYDVYTRTQNLGSSTIFPGQSTNLRAQAFNDGATTSAAITKNIYEFVFEDTASVPSFSEFNNTKTLKNGDSVEFAEPGSAFNGSGSVGCSWIESLYATVPGTCRTVTPSGWSAAQVSSSNSWQNLGPSPSTTTIDADDYIPGQVVCQLIAIRNFDIAHPTGNNERRVSEPVCIQVRGNQPLFQVHGGDLRVNGLLQSGVNTNGSSLFGSWGEYGVFSSGINTNVASGAGLNGGSTDSSGDGWNRLTFSNTSSLQRGLFVSDLTSLSLYGGFYTNTGDTIANPGSFSLTGQNGYYTSASNVTITGGTIDQSGGVGRSIIVRSTGTIRISGNIIYDDSGGLTDISQIPQVVIVANNIEIEGGVNRIDAWLLTTGLNGSINTCIDRTLSQPLNNTVCAQQLTVNGPIVTNNLHLRRTAQASQPDGVAEIFNLRPDALLWARDTAISTKKLQTVHSVELAPRF